MSNETRIGTLNLCLGLRNKKEEVKRLIVEKNIDILCMQETEIPKEFPIQMLTFKGYNFENENDSYKSRCGIYISNNVSYLRRNDLETNGIHAIIIDLKDVNKTRIINVYRSFNPPNSLSQREYFDSLLELISQNANLNTILIGDFNLDFRKRFDITYSHKQYYLALNESLPDFMQVVNFPTWSRTINNEHHESIIDHIYVKDPTQICNISECSPPFGDHKLIKFSISSINKGKKPIFKRNWKSYNKESLITELSKINWVIENDDVQSYWNSFESKLIEIVDSLAPMGITSENNAKITPPQFIKSKINKRNNLKKKIKHNHVNQQVLQQNLKSLNKEIKNFFYQNKTKSVRRGILPGNSKTLWDAVRVAKDLNSSPLPEILFNNNTEILYNNQAEAFGHFFSDKVTKITRSTILNPEVYNGVPKINCNNDFFMSRSEVETCLKSIKLKNSEGYDRIPQRILADGALILLTPLTKLFNLIYHQKAIPAQWSVSKIIPIHKKGPKCHIENYRPISNLCSTSKIFERLILKRMQSIETLYQIDLTGKQQHGFKRGKSTASLALQIQSLIARALDEDNYVVMASIDLSAAFDVVNIDLLMKRLRIIGLPEDVLSLIEIWLKNRQFYVEINNQSSILHNINFGTIQGSILGPILYAIYVAPLFDLTDLSNFADDNFALTWCTNKENARSKMAIKIKLISDWLKDSGLKVNEGKTEVCLFYRKDTTPIEIDVNNNLIKSMSHMNVLGVEFDSKLTWTYHIAKQINKANKALHAIKMIKKYFSRKELLTLLTSNFYSILYYNSEVWHLPTLNSELKQMLLSASAKALKISQRRPDPMESYLNVHKSCERALPSQILEFKHAVVLHNIYNTQIPKDDWIDLNFNQILTSRQTKFQTSKSNNFKIGNNKLISRLSILNNKINLDDLNLSLANFKVKYKKKLL